MRLEFSSGSAADLEEIWDYSARNWGSAKAVEYLDGIADCAEALARGDLSGTAEDQMKPGLRRQVVQSHVIWFRVSKDGLFVVRVLHGSRDAGRWV